MSDKKKFERKKWSITCKEIMRGAKKYTEAIAGAMKIEQKGDADPGIDIAVMEMVKMGYALGIIAGSSSDIGLEGFTLVLTGMKLYLEIEDRKEKMQFAVWDKYGMLHTSDEAYEKKEGGEQ